MDIKTEIEKNGFVYLKNQDASSLNDLTSKLGEVFHTTNVEVKPNSKALVTSDRALDFHTDHHKVKYIVWYCHKQASHGGITKLIHARDIISQLSGDEREALKKVFFTEHKIFPDDEGVAPMIRENNGKYLLYYSFWLDNDADRSNSSYLKFRRAVENSPCVSINWQKNDILAIDNQTVLHARSAIQGDKNRLIERHWLI